MSSGSKICKKCGVEKPIVSGDGKKNFYAHPSTRDKYRNDCSECCNKVSEKWREKNPDKVKANVALHAEKRRAAAKKWREDNPEKVKAQRERVKMRRKRNG